MYRHVDVLNSAGMSAAIVHTRPGFACSWFDHKTAVMAASSVRLGADDVVMVPEFYDHRLLNLPIAVRLVIFNQNTYRTFHGQAAQFIGNVGQANQKVAAILVVSQDNLEYASYAFPSLPVKRVRLAVNSDVFYASDQLPGRRIAVMPRRRAADCRQVLTLLALRGLLSSWQVVVIDGHSERETADLLRSCSIFLSFSDQEGFGLPPAEAMACGCYVVGFTGLAGREYFQAGTSIAVEEGDVLAMAKAVEGVLEVFNEDPLGIRQRGLAASSKILGDYSPEAERSDLLSFVQSLPLCSHLSYE
jgi:Glycosyl transferases group 1